MRDLQGFLRERDIIRIYNAAEGYRDKALIRLLWKSGRRITEILLVRVSDIDFEDNAIVWHIEKKTKKVEGERVKFDLRKRKPIDNFTAKLLRHYIYEYGLKDNDFLFPSPVHKDRPITRQRAFQIVRRVCEKAGIYYVGNKKPHPHHFRHSFAVNAVKKMKSPAGVRKLQMFLEHSTLGITENYLQFADDDLRELVED